jgi:glycosyltransferase involved in cell wall biosynthesis
MATLSVLTPVFNYEWCVEDALRSVMESGRHLSSDWAVEHIVVDDGSEDGSSVVLKAWESRITFVLEARNRGQSRTLNQCLDISTGEWIGWLNADDFYLPWSLQDVCSALGDTVDVVYGDAVVVDRAGRFDRLMAEHPFSLWTLRWWGTYLPVGSVFLRRSLLEQLGWRHDLALLLDWDLWLRAAESGARFRYLPSPLVALRRHSGQESRQMRPGRLEEKARVRRDHGLPSKPWVWRAFQRVGAIDHGLRKVACGSYARQIRSNGFKRHSMRWFAEPEGWASVVSLYELGYRRRQAGAVPK